MADQPTEKPMEKPRSQMDQMDQGSSCKPSILATWGEQKINTGGDSLESSPGFAGD
ncbi:toxin biosynthesis protein [Aspergillus luchuensis]|uniref:Toxin biosynthesis protein n=1 Tax=Aspergillus kawachii TaxID=1069201 RepID=A0A146F4N2_ASPKA|nr:toxin biosynthesis protein [Aspergillus luchuensis]